MPEKFSQADVNLELERISRNIPDELLENLYQEEEANVTIKTVIAKALDDDEFPEEKKERYRTLLNSGKLDGTVEREQEDVREEIEEWLEDEIQKSIKAGRLPDRDSDEYKQLINDIKNDDEQGTSEGADE